jgi:hypothetical protein
MQYEGFDDIYIDNYNNGTITYGMDTLSICDSNGMEKSVNISDETRIVIPDINIQIYR